jgi:hypothetical protein
VGEPRWPSKQADGTVSVAVRLEVGGPQALGSVKQSIARWVAEKKEAGVALQCDLSSPPAAELTDPSRIDVVLNGTPDSRRWKDWMVDLAQELSSIYDVQVAGFEDRVPGTFREA